MDYSKEMNYMKGFLPYALAAFLVGIVGRLSTVLGPAFMLDMNLAYNNTTWSALTQTISSAACAPILGKLADIFGKKKTLLLGILVFTLGSILSALSVSLVFLLIARFVVGIGTAAISPTIMSYIITEFPQKQISKGFSLYMLLSSVAVIFGPTLGGLILEYSHWRTLMWISSIICGVFLLLCFLTLPKESFYRRPLKAFILPVIVLFLTQGLMQANMTNTIVFVNYTQPTNTSVSGYAISIMYIGMSFGSILLGPLVDRFEPKYILNGSLLLTALGCGTMLFFSQTTSFFLLASSLGILGLGLGGNATIFMRIVLSNLPQETAGAGTGIYGLFRDLAAPFGVAVFVPMFTNKITSLSANTALNLSPATVAVNSIHSLAMVELICVAAGLFIVQLLPKIHPNKHIKKELSSD